MKDFSSKKAVSLAFNTVIIAVIALLVLGILIFMLIRTMGNSSEATACFEKAGICMKECSGIYSDSSLGQELCSGSKTCCLAGVE
jgi:hypothetical protein